VIRSRISRIARFEGLGVGEHLVEQRTPDDVADRWSGRSAATACLMSSISTIDFTRVHPAEIGYGGHTDRHVVLRGSPAAR